MGGEECDSGGVRGVEYQLGDPGEVQGDVWDRVEWEQCAVDGAVAMLF